MTPNIENKFLSSNIPTESRKGRIVPVNFQIHFHKLWLIKKYVLWCYSWIILVLD